MTAAKNVSGGLYPAGRDAEKRGRTCTRERKFAVAPIRVLLVDDHRLFLDGLVRLIGSNTDLAVVGVAQTAAGAVTAARNGQPDVAVIDFELADRDGVALTEELQRSWPELPCMILTGYPHQARVALAMSNARHCSVHSKTTDADTLLTALRSHGPTINGGDHPQLTTAREPALPRPRPPVLAVGKAMNHAGNSDAATNAQLNPLRAPADEDTPAGEELVGRALSS